MRSCNLISGMRLAHDANVSPAIKKNILVATLYHLVEMFNATFIYYILKNKRHFATIKKPALLLAAGNR